jgi:hypothetical protein
MEWLLSPTELNGVEKFIDVLANAIVGFMCIIMCVVLIRIWRKTDNRRYPKWTLIAMGCFCGGYSIRRLLVLLTISTDIPRLFMVWELILLFTTGFGMYGEIVLARWVQARTYTLDHSLYDANTAITELKAKAVSLESKLALLEHNNVSNSSAS